MCISSMFQSSLFSSKEAKSERILQRLKSKLRKYDLIVLDELCYISFDKWNEIFHGSIIMVVIVDCITHKSYVINMSGMSYRLQESKELLRQSVDS